MSARAPIRQQALRWLRYRALFRPLAALPGPLAYRGAGLVGRLDRRRQPATAAAVAAGVRRVFPHFDEAMIDRCVRGYFAMAARELTDAFYIRRLSPAAGGRLTRLSDGSLQRLHAAKSGGRGAIVAMGHYGRVNMLLLALALAGERVGMLTMATDRSNPYLDAVERRYLDDKIGALLRHVGGPRLCLGDDLRGLYRALRDGATMVILADVYSPERGQRTLPTPFLGGTLTTPTGIARLAHKTGAAVLYGVARERGRAVEAELREPLRRGDDRHAPLRAVLAELEKDIRAEPWLWWQWGLLDYIWTPSAAAPQP